MCLIAAVDRSGSDKNRKLDDADEAGHIEKVGLDLRIKIQQGRMAKKMTQVKALFHPCRPQSPAPMTSTLDPHTLLEPAGCLGESEQLHPEKLTLRDRGTL